METYQYKGIRPHIQAASRANSADAARVEQNQAVNRLNGLLCTAASYYGKGNIEVAARTLDAARTSLADIDAAAVAAHAAFDEVAAKILAQAPIEGDPAPAPVAVEDAPASEADLPAKKGKK